MKKTLVIPVLAALVIAGAMPAAACDGHSKGATSATAAAAAAAGKGTCSMAHSMAWAGAWLQRSPEGALTVAAVSEGSPAARSGLRAGDVVVAVNGRTLAEGQGHAACSAGADCSVGRSFAYTVQRGSATRVVRLKLERMPAEAVARFADREASFDPALAALVLPVAD